MTPEPGTRRSDHDMRLSVLNYPLDGWVDAVTMNLCMGLAVVAQLSDMQQVSYQPLADVLRKVTPVETRHVELAEEGLARLADQGQRDAIADALSYWRPRVAAIFGKAAEDRFGQLKAWGLRHQNNAALLQGWNDALNAALARLGVAA